MINIRIFCIDGLLSQGRFEHLHVNKILVIFVWKQSFFKWNLIWINLKNELLKLEQKYGKEKLDRAIKISSVVSGENNIQTIQAFIDLEDQYGPDILEKARQKIAQKKADNPKRTVGYLINTIRSMANQKK